MTAFATTQTQNKFGLINWEIRSVNHRYLDVNFRIPESFRELEPVLRECVKAEIQRGRIDCTLRYQPASEISSDITIDQASLQSLKKVLQTIKGKFGNESSINPIDILRWPGVIKADEDKLPEAEKQVLSVFTSTLKKLNQARAVEGKQLKAFIEERLKKIDKETVVVHKHVPSILKAQRERLLTRFKEAKLELDNDRLEQEMVFLAQKADVAEELDRIKIHTDETRRILKSGGIAGKRLDFLMQEFNREANTLGSKSISPITTQVSVELKVLIDQMREQVQNVE